MATTKPVIPISREEYQAAIPANCRYKTLLEHEQEMMLCWGLMNSIRTKTPLNCSICEVSKTKQIP